MNQSGRVGDEAKKRKSPAKSGRVGITGLEMWITLWYFKILRIHNSGKIHFLMLSTSKVSNLLLKAKVVSRVIIVIAVGLHDTRSQPSLRFVTSSTFHIERMQEVIPPPHPPHISGVIELIFLHLLKEPYNFPFKENWARNWLLACYMNFP